MNIRFLVRLFVISAVAASLNATATAQNYRVSAVKSGQNAYSDESNPPSVRYAILDLGSELQPRRVANNGVVLLGGDGSFQRWNQGQLETMDGNAFDMNNQGTIVGSISAPEYWLYKPGFFYQHDLTTVPAIWPLGQTQPQRLNAAQPTPDDPMPQEAHTFSFDLVVTENLQHYTGTLSDGSARTIDDDGHIFGSDLIDYQQRDYFYDPIFEPSQYAAFSDGTEDGTQLGTVVMSYVNGNYWVDGDARIVTLSRNGVSIGSKTTLHQVVDSTPYPIPLTLTMINDTAVDFEPLNLNSQGMVLARDGGGHYFLYDSGTQQRTSLGVAPPQYFTWPPPPYDFPLAINDRMITITGADGTPTTKKSPQAVGYEQEFIFTPPFFKWRATIWEENPKTQQYQMRYLNQMIPKDSGWDLQYAHDINDGGMIGCTGWYQVKDDDGNPVGDPEWKACLLIPIEVVTKGKDGKLVPQSFTYNSVAPPKIFAAITGSSISADGVVTLTVSGTVTDDTSDLIDDPSKQLQTLTISTPGISQTVNLATDAAPELPWQPYKFSSTFSQQISFTAGGPGEYPVTLTTSENAGGVAAMTEQVVVVAPTSYYVALTGSLNAVAIDSIRFYIGASTGDPSEIMSETAANSKQFVHGTGDDGMKIEILSSGELTGQVDTLQVRLTRSSGGISQNLDMLMTETGADTRVFEFSALTASGGSFPATAPGNFMPSMIRMPASVMWDDTTRINTFGRDWPVATKNFGDGDFPYAVDDQSNAVVFNPSASGPGYIQTQPVDATTGLAVTVKVGGNAIVTKTTPATNGLFVFGDDVSDLLQDFAVSNWERTPYSLDGRTGYNYTTKRNQTLGHSGTLVGTEVLWRYIRTQSVVKFSSKAELRKDVLYRTTIVTLAKNNCHFHFGRDPVSGVQSGNPNFWIKGALRGGTRTNSAIAALIDMFDSGVGHPDSYYMGCELAVAFLHYRAASLALGERVFDSKVNLHIEGTRKQVEDDQKNTMFFGNDKILSNWIPGDIGYIRNTSITEASRIQGANGEDYDRNWKSSHSGENIVYMGNCYDIEEGAFKAHARFWGHFDDSSTEKTRTLQQWINEVHSWSQRTTLPSKPVDADAVILSNRRSLLLE
jgi:protein-glutamine gamma-glutamyltransferase-like protein